MGYCQEWSGRHAEAQQSFTRAVESIKPTGDTVVPADADNRPSALALAYAGLGQKRKAIEQAERAVKDYQTDAVTKPSAMIVLAQIQCLFGDNEPAIALLPQLLTMPAGLTVASVKLDPGWDPLRKDPRFQQIVASVAKEVK